MGDEIDLQRLWALLVDHIWLIVGTTVLALALGLTYAYLTTPIYKADALLQVEKKQAGLPGFEELSEMFAEESSSNAEMQIIRSRLVLGQVVDQFNMAVELYPNRFPLLGKFTAPQPASEFTQKPLFAGYRDSETFITVDSFDVPDKWLGQAFTLKAKEDGGVALYFKGELVASGPSEKPIVSEDGRVRLLLGQWQPGEEELALKRESRLTAINRLSGELTVSEQGKDSGIINLSLTGPNPKRIREVLNAIAQTYQTQNIQRNAAEAEKSLEFLDEQLPEIKEKLTTAEEQLNKYRLKSESVDLSLETQSVLERLVGIEAKLNELKIKESEISARFTQSHPAYRTLLQQRQSLLQEKKQIEGQIKGLPETQQEVLRMMRDVEVNQQIYVGLLNKVQELRILKASTVGNVRIIDEALVQPSPVKPKTGLLAALSALLGFIGALTYVFLSAALHRGIQSPEQLEERGIPVYAAVPLSEHQQKLDRLVALMRRRRRNRQEPIPLLSLDDPADLAVEALRSLRTSLHFAMLEAENKIMMISGPSPEVGKSFISANLAAVLAQVGQKVVVVDADMRKGHLHRYFENQNDFGISDWLAGQVDKEKIVHETKVENLHFIPRGQVPPNPAELLMHPRFRELMEYLSNNYDLVLVDTPPILAVTDAAIIGQLAGTSLIVTRYGQNSVKEVDVTFNRFEQNNVNIKGAILNCIERRASNEYGYYAYRYNSDNS
ncbi:polysaccharide biosynthesis tyrosine autokinase [Alcanivorax sp. ZXX171]|nr:polysaccharide biosynthesis tyrosine autokinase [Alcanivorax sp. ZXX171]